MNIEYLEMFLNIFELIHSSTSDATTVIFGDFSLPNCNNIDNRKYQLLNNFCSFFNVGNHNGVLNKIRCVFLPNLFLTIVAVHQPTLKF